MVLKLSMVGSYLASRSVSVPLRGYGFEIRNLRPVTTPSPKTFPSTCGDMVLKCTSHLFALLRDAVSVPLRGYGFEICVLPEERMIYYESFRPLAGIWF